MQAVAEHSTPTKAAAKLGISESALRRSLKEAAIKGISTNSPPPPDGFKTKGVSTLYGSEGEIKAQWVKDELDGTKHQIFMEEALAAFLEPLKGLHKPTKAPRVDTDEYMTGFPIGDAHIGLLAWGQQTGNADWDTAIAERTICATMDEIIHDAPATEECWIWQLGDFMHIDNDAGTTTAGTPQDHDGRYQKIVYAAVRCVRHITERALAKYKVVNFRNAKGNHDKNASVALDVAMMNAYENEPRLILHDSPKHVFIHRWQSNLFGITHGHKPKPRAIAGNMANDSGEDWGRSNNKYAHHGHFHQKEKAVFQDLLVNVECHAAATAPDDWTIGQGYRSTSEVKAIVYHKDEGEKRRYTSQIKPV